MAEKFTWKKFKDIDLNDSFFDSLKNDYPEFPEWFKKKSNSDESALVYYDSIGVAAFIYLKRENEKISLVDGAIPAAERLKIGTLKLSERIRSQRLGEGALGVALWYWQQVKYNEIYVTAFEKHTQLVNLFERFGFSCIGKNERGECIFLKDKRKLSFEDPYKSFPFISGNNSAGLIPIEDRYHDRLFPYSELYGSKKEIEEITAGNGITKIYIATPYSDLTYKENMPVFMYRKFTGIGQKIYKSVVTSLCTINRVIQIKKNFQPLVSFEEFVNIAGNKTVYPEDQLLEKYTSSKNIVAIELVYNLYFGKGHNVTCADLKNNSLFETYPYQIRYSRKELEKILELGDKDVSNIIID